MNIEVVLTVDDAKLGKRGQIVKVSPGYAHNFLIPQAKAKLATASNLKAFEAEKQKHAKHEAATREHAETLAKQIHASSVTIEVQAGEGDKLYGAVTTQDIQKALENHKIIVERKTIHLEEPIRNLGAFQIPVKLHAEVNATLKLWVVKKK